MSNSAYIPQINAPSELISVLNLRHFFSFREVVRVWGIVLMTVLVTASPSLSLKAFADDPRELNLTPKEVSSSFVGPQRPKRAAESAPVNKEERGDSVTKRAESRSLPAALTLVNRRFLESLREPIAHERSTLGPAIFFERNVLKLVKGGEVIASAKAAPTIFFHQVKAYSHMCMTVAVKLWRLREVTHQRQWASEYIVEVDAAQQAVKTLGLSTSVAARQITLSALTHAILDEASEKKISSGRLQAYINSVKPLILKNFDDAAQDHIDQLDRAFKELSSVLTEEELGQLQAFTYGPRGPRSGNLIVQYLAHLMGQEELVEGARVVYAEAVSEAEATFNLMSKFNIEQALGVIFFEDPMGLQRDVLADSARRILSARPRKRLTSLPSERLLKPLSE